MSQEESAHVHSRRKRIWLTLYAVLGVIILGLIYGFLSYYSTNFIDSEISSWVANAINTFLNCFIFVLIWVLGLCAFVRHLGRLLGYEKFRIVDALGEQTLGEANLVFLVIPIGIVALSFSVESLFDSLDFKGYTPELAVAIFMVLGAMHLAQLFAAIWVRTDDAPPEQRAGAT